MKKDNMLITFLWVGYVIISIVAILFGYFNYSLNTDKYNLYIFLAILAASVMMCIIYFVSTAYSKKKARVIRDVSIDSTNVINGEADKVAVLHVDNVDETKVVVSVYKKKVTPTDIVGTINNDN